MNPISIFFTEHIIAVYFFYGLAFFAMGLVLTAASRQASTFEFARVIPVLALFGLLHGAHEWFEMFQKIAALSNGHAPTTVEEAVRLLLLVGSFIMLLSFGSFLLYGQAINPWQKYWPVLGLISVWAGSILLIGLIWGSHSLLDLIDVLSRYTLGIPGALLGGWALMRQQRIFRAHNMSKFGRDLVWCAVALLLYGAIGQIFVRQTALIPSTVINNTLFLAWFGIPVQLFRGIMAMLLAYYMTRALRVFELEGRLRLDQAQQARSKAQAEALAAERRSSREMKQLNEELRLTTRELLFLLDLSKLLVTPMSLSERLQGVLEKIINNLTFPKAAMILLRQGQIPDLSMPAAVGFSQNGASKDDRLTAARELGRECLRKRVALCRHEDGHVIEFLLEEALLTQRCQGHRSPTVMIGLPLATQQQIIGALVLASAASQGAQITFDEFKLMVSIGQQLGLSIENARLYQEAQQREQTLENLLHQVVGAQEAERQRIARELHDATGQSLTAMSLGLRGIEALLDSSRPIQAEQIQELKLFGTNALAELRQIIADLRPPQLDDLGLVPALQWYSQSFEKRYGLKTVLTMAGDPRRLPAEYETVLFRIAQEGLTNVAKHARAAQVTITLNWEPSHICLSIQDDGQGFDPARMAGAKQSGGWGLLGIRERATLLGGSYEIHSKPGCGTRIQIVVPLAGKEAHVKEDKAVAG